MTEPIANQRMESNKGTRIEWIDIGKFICIMFVMLSHLESGTDSLMRVYGPFFLTGFFFLSGYVYREVLTFKEHFIKKVKGLFVPWFVFSHFNILLSQIITLKERRSLLECLMWNWLQIRGKDDGMWFVAALFITYIPFYFFVKQKRPRVVIILSVLLSLISIIYTKVAMPEFFPWNTVNLPWHIEYVFQAMLWMLLGYYFKIYGEYIVDKYNNKLTCVVLWGAYLFMVYAFSGDYSNWINIPLEYLVSALGILSIISLCKLVKSNKYFMFVGANTLTFFGLHGKVYAVLEKLMAVFAGEIYQVILKNSLLSNIFAIMLTVLLSLILIIPAMIINKWFPWVLGRTRK